MSEWTTKRLIVFSIWWPMLWTVLAVLAAHAIKVHWYPQDARYATAIILCTIIPSLTLAFPIGTLLKACPQAKRQVIIASASLITFIAFFGACAMFNGMLQVK
jgi:hypothetical protein